MSFDLDGKESKHNSPPPHTLATITSIKGDKEIATELRKKFYDALAPVAELIAEAEQNGFEVGFQFGKNAFGKAQIQIINIMKKY